jgi:dienelactone hydrolase
MSMRKAAVAAVAILALVLAAAPGAQTKPPVTKADFGKWESLSPPARDALSGDGRWLAYRINRSNRENELRLLRLADDHLLTVPYGGLPTFASNSAWAAYAIGHSQAEQDRMREARTPVQNKLGLTNLASGEQTEIPGVQSFALSGDGRFIAMRRYAPQPPQGGATPAGGRSGGRGGGRGAAPPGDDDADPVGVTVIVRSLDDGRDTTFGNVSSFAWQDDDATHALALTIAADGRQGNGVHLFDAATGTLRVLDSAPAVYTGLSWREGSADLVVLKTLSDDRHADPTHRVLAWRGLSTPSEHAQTFDPTSATGVPSGMRIAPFRTPSWSKDGGRIFVGIAEWTEKPEPAAGPRGTGRGGAAADAEAQGRGGGRGGGRRAVPAEPEPADVDIWHWKDAAVMARQKTAAAQDRRRSLLSAWHLDTNQFVQLAQSHSEQVSPIDGTDVALVEEWSDYEMQRSMGRPAADLYLADLATGARTRLKDRLEGGRASVSPGGRYLLYVEGGHWWTLSLSTKAAVNITRSLRTSFVDLDSDSTAPTRPSFGVGGWTADDGRVLLYDDFDIWSVSPDGSGGERLTQGAADRVRHRLVRLDPERDTIDLAAPVYVSLFGTQSKRSGYGLLRPGGGVERLLFEDQAITSLSKAAGADVFVYMAQTHADSPDTFVSGPSLANPRQVTHTNAFQSDYAWSRSEIVTYKSEKGLALQGALYYPAGYEPGRRYPMIVYLYERLSDNVHRYVAPSETSYYNTTVFTSQGYFVLQPDIVFRPREPGLSVVECVRPAVKAVVDRGLADERRVGVVGHSWGGFDTAFLATHSTTFAAAVAGAPITNLVSNYGNHHWSSGIAETDHIETGQQRMVVPVYDDLQAYMRNSAVFGVGAMTTPLLLMTGDNDGTVFWHQSVELYNIARRAGKNVVMLVYNNEDHGLRLEKNQSDYQQRILDWFGHYLKRDEPKKWITDGRAFLERGR